MGFFVAEPAAFDLEIYNTGNIRNAKLAGDTAHSAARLQLEAHPATTPEDLIAFDLNHEARVGPWTDAKYGTQ
jgi:hypothetical protein